MVAMQGVRGTSQAEIETMANVIILFDSLEIIKLNKSPLYLVIKGKFLIKYLVNIIPQYSSGRYSIDLVIHLYKLIDNEECSIASIGIEYDGHVAHYVESNIKRSYIRDANIISNNGIPLFKISPEQKNNIEFVRKSIKKYFKNQIRKISRIQKNTVSDIISHVTSYDETKAILEKECPVCYGIGSLANQFCPICNGIGRVSNAHLKSIDISKYSGFDCPECSVVSSCKICKGKGWIDRDSAIEWQKKHYKKD